MAPTRKSRSVYKRFSNLNEVSPDKDVGSSKSSRNRKKKLSDLLGPQWSKEELERFYEGYRKHGKDWKKVAAAVRNRSVDMVEALYNMNRAYLSLPEGTASVVGLVAMMTDHYNVLEGSDEEESNDRTEVRNTPKRKRGKVQLGGSREDLHAKADLSNDGCLSLLKRRRADSSEPRVVGKRTPRFPVSFLYKKDGRENHVSLSKRGRKSVADATDDDVAHGAALVLTAASHRGGSPQVSRSPYGRKVQSKVSPVQSWERMHSQSNATKYGDASLDEEWLEGSIGSRGTENGDYEKYTRSLMDIEGVGTVEVGRKGKKFYGKKEKVEGIEEKEFEDGGGACSGTEEGGNDNSLKGKVKFEAPNEKIEHSHQTQRKRSKKLFFGDESSDLDALQTLADLSLMMPVSTMESESSVQLKEEKTARDIDDKFTVPEATSADRQRDKVLGKEKTSAVDSRKSNLARASAINSDAISKAKGQLLSSNKSGKRKSKPMASKLQVINAEAHNNFHLGESLKNEASAEEGKTLVGQPSMGEFKLAFARECRASLSKAKKSAKSAQNSSDIDQKGRETDLVGLISQVPAENQVNLLTKSRSRRKKDLQQALKPKEMSGSDSTMRNRIDKRGIYVHDKALYLKDKLSSCLSSNFARRWCIFEWFYSAIDYPWFAKREFVDYLNHVGLGRIPRLTRVEWSVIRSSLGKPRRFSENFLHEERKKLELYRESVRKHYTELRTGVREGLPTDLARPLSVGQRVIALHPKTREVHDGSVLTVDHDKCRIQFDRPDIGVEFVMDVDCMPLNPLDNMPEALRRRSLFVDKFPVISKEPQMEGNISFGGGLLYDSTGHLANVRSPISNLMKQAKTVGSYSMRNQCGSCSWSALSCWKDSNHAIFQGKVAAPGVVSTQQTFCSQPCRTVYSQAREADIQALSDLTHALDKKEALLMELRNMNNDVLDDQINEDGSLKDSESFKKHYATVLVQLKEAGGQASSALVHLRERNTYPGNPLPPWFKTTVNSVTAIGLPRELDKYLYPHESGCNVHEIVKVSRLKAQTMVDKAIQAISSLKEGEDAFTRIGEALDSINDQQLTSDVKLSGVTSPEKVNGSLVPNNQSNACPSETNQLSGSKPCTTDADKNETQIPAELITSCVATLLMIQTCTDRHYPPADVAQILDSAVTSLHPCCPQNLPLYREIQMSMGRLKTQMLALVPTQI
ncbi:protein ALWAYS EARLY 2-like isoform X3 [Rhodamnia argentea]|uniref:Protein ALWAYS EARLY 2-like isoform X3 n=1 Tax=Rhodamnia argentea TaxID=178133 RepID=A0ABM3H9P2_9MYRT|nr:protein ALWAYS EARLY 2-like isoform X3 [Rhodamnia argentea]